MRLSRRLILLLALTIVGSALFISFTISVETLTKFNQIEDQELSDNLGRLSDAVSARLDSLQSKNGDWANWDDNYNFILGKNPDFVAINLTDNAMVQLNISGMIFYNHDRQLVINKFADPLTGTEQTVPTGLVEKIGQSRLLDFSRSSGNRGLIENQQLDYLVSARPILTSDGNGPAVGSLVFLRQLDQPLVTALGKTIHLQVDKYRYTDAALPSDVVQILPTISPTVQPQLHLSGQLTSGYSLVTDAITQRPIIIWRVTMPRTAYALGRQTVVIFIIYFSVIGAVAGLILLKLLQRNILRRLEAYAATLQRIRQTGNLNERVPVTRNDEITTVGQTINEFIAKLRQSLDTLTQERDKASAIVQSMAEGLLVLNKELAIINMNETAEKLLGVSRAQAIGRPWTDVVIAYRGAKEIPLSERSAYKVLASGRSIATRVDDDHYFQTRAGKRFPVVSVTSPYHGEGVEGVVVVFRDVTDERQTQQKIEQEVVEQTKAVREGRARLLGSINALTLGYIMTDQNGSILLINQAAIKLLCNTDLDHVKAVASAAPALDFQCTIEQITEELHQSFDLKTEIQKSLKNRQSAEFNKVVFRDAYLNVLLSPIVIDEKGIGVVVLVEDVTNEVALDRSKDEFFSIASHELRTPLTTIEGNASMIRDYFAEKIKDAELKEMIGDIEESSKRLIVIVNDFLNTSRLEQGRLSFKISQFDLADLVTKTVRELQPLAKERGLKLTVQAPKKMLVYADPDRAKEVLTNLVSNGLKYTEKGSVTVALTQGKLLAEVRVTDTGRGLSLENQKRLFQKFQQASDNIYIRDPQKSTGLGLYISKLLVLGMHGTIALERSAVGKGSTFLFCLPQTDHATTAVTADSVTPVVKEK